MGRVSRTEGKGKLSESGPIENKYAGFWSQSASSVAGDGEVCGNSYQISKDELDALEAYLIKGEGAPKFQEENSNGESKMSIWTRWFNPAPSYFDRITHVVEEITDLECTLRDDEQAAHERLHEIAVARRELAVRVRRA